MLCEIIVLMAQVVRALLAHTLDGGGNCEAGITGALVGVVDSDLALGNLEAGIAPRVNFRGEDVVEDCVVLFRDIVWPVLYVPHRLDQTTESSHAPVIESGPDVVHVVNAGENMNRDPFVRSPVLNETRLMQLAIVPKHVVDRWRDQPLQEPVYAVHLDELHRIEALLELLNEMGYGIIEPVTFPLHVDAGIARHCLPSPPTLEGAEHPTEELKAVKGPLDPHPLPESDGALPERTRQFRVRRRALFDVDVCKLAHGRVYLLQPGHIPESKAACETLVSAAREGQGHLDGDAKVLWERSLPAASIHATDRPTQATALQELLDIAHLAVIHWCERKVHGARCLFQHTRGHSQHVGDQLHPICIPVWQC